MMLESKPFLVIVVVHAIYAGYFLLTKLAFDVGMNTFVFVFYRQALATIFLTPIAIFLERKTAPRLSFSTFIKIFLLAFFGITASLNLVGVGLKYTSASLGAASSNTLPVVTFFIAVLLRKEELNIKRKPGMMKMAGVSLCAGGVATIAFYRGPLLKLLMHHHLIRSHSPQLHGHVPDANTWTKGVFLLLLSVFTWTSWIVLQGGVLKSYPSKLLLTTMQCFLSTIQSFITAVAFARNPSQWKLGWNLRLLSIAYCGIVVTGGTYYLQSWLIEKKGPVFLAMTTPLSLVFTTIMSAFVLGEVISLGSVVGAILLVGGLYFLLWGKLKEEESAKEASQPMGDAEKGSPGESKQDVES